MEYENWNENEFEYTVGKRKMDGMTGEQQLGKDQQQEQEQEAAGAAGTHFIKGIKLNWIKNKLIRSTIKLSEKRVTYINMNCAYGKQFTSHLNSFPSVE